MKKIILVVFILFIFTSSMFADELYTWKDKDGVINISNIPPPETAKVLNTTKYQRVSEREIEAFEQKQKASTENSYKDWQRSQTQAPSTQATSQKEREPRDVSGRTPVKGLLDTTQFEKLPER